MTTYILVKNINVRMISFILICILAVAEGRLGWKTSGNGYIIYEAQTNYSNTKSMMILGKFSTQKGSQINNVLLAFDDANGNLVGQVSLWKGLLYININDRKGGLKTSGRTIKGSDLGYLFSFALRISSQKASDRSWVNQISTYVTGGHPWLPLTVENSDPWELNNITFYIGGYKRAVHAGYFFEGCISNITFKSFDITSAYFQQYPNNTNPRRSAVTFGNFSNSLETCNDAVFTQKPTPTTIPATSEVKHTTKRNPNVASVCVISRIFLFISICFVLPFYFFKD